MTINSSVEAFFFRRMSANGFSLMRICWAACALLVMITQWNDIVYYYSNAGESLGTYHVTLLSWFSSASAVTMAYYATLVCMTFMLLGIFPRTATIASVLFFFSFQEKNPLLTGGGDTLLRTIGFLLMIAPGIAGFSLSRLRKKWLHWKKNRTIPPPLTMPIWPWRLLLWQMILLYGTSLWYKLLGSTWMSGDAVNMILLNPLFARWPESWMQHLIPFGIFFAYATMIWEALWLLFLLPFFSNEVFRRFMIGTGILFHGSIFVLFDVGIFSLAVFTAYVGLLRDEDWMWLKQMMKKILNPASRTITVLYDGQCGLCRRSIFTLSILDWMHVLRYMDFRNTYVREKEAPGMTEALLDKAMHIRLANGHYMKGFDAFRRMTHVLPPLWLLAPFLYIPGIPQLGRVFYAKIAANRQKCDHESCGL